MNKHAEKDSTFYRIKNRWDEYKWLLYKKRYAKLYERFNQKSNEDIYCMMAYYEEKVNTSVEHTHTISIIIFIGTMAVTLAIGDMSTNVGAVQNAVTAGLSLASSLLLEREQVVQAVNIAADTNVKVMEIVSKATVILFWYMVAITLLAIGVMVRPIFAHNILKKQVCERIFNEKVAGGQMKRDAGSVHAHSQRKGDSDNILVLRQRRRRKYK